MQIHHALLGAFLFNATVALAQQAAPAAPAQPLGFFVTSSGLGKGADLGGLSGADAKIPCGKIDKNIQVFTGKSKANAETCKSEEL